MLALATAGAATPASAEWLGTRWGQTPEQAKAGNEAGEGFVPLTHFAFVTDDPASTPDSRILLLAEAEPEDTSQPMHVRFGFDAQNRLNRLLLDVVIVAQCTEIHRQFLALLGQPAPRDRAAMPNVLRWRSQGPNDIEVRIDGTVAAPRGCSVTYRPAGAMP